MSPTPAARLAADLEAIVAPREIAVARAWWTAYTDASPEAEQRRTAAELALRDCYADTDAFAALSSTRDGPDGDPVVARQIDVLHDAFLPHQVTDRLRERIVLLETSIESSFATFRGEIDGQAVDDNTILDVLRSSGPRGRPPNRSAPTSPPGSASWPTPAMTPPASSATATTLPSRWPPAS